MGIAADQVLTTWRNAGSTSAGGKTWFGTGFKADTAYDHCVSLCGYGTFAWLAQQLWVPVPAGIDGTRQGYAMFTWDSIGIIDEPSLHAITCEAWLRQPTTIIKRTGQPAWNDDWFPLPGKAVFDLQHQQIAAVSRSPNNLDLFVIGNDDHVWSTFWNPQTGWNGDWFPLPGKAVFNRQSQQIAAVTRSRDNLDLFVIGNDDHGWSTFWSA